MCKVRRDIYNKVTDLRAESDKWFNWGLVFIVLLVISPPFIHWLCPILFFVLVGFLSLAMFTCIFKCVLIERTADKLSNKVINMLMEEADNARHGDDP